MRIELEHTIDAGHRIVGHKGKCARLHGHTYRFKIAVEGKVTDPGFVIDFGDIKDVLNEWDHMLLLWKEDPIGFTYDDVLLNLKEENEEEGVLRLTFNPTAENMARSVADRIARINAPHLSYVEVIVWETPKACAQICISPLYDKDGQYVGYREEI